MTLPVGRSASVQVSATSANLGPGYDCAGLCLSLYDDLTATVIDHGLEIEVDGHGADDVPKDDSHLVVRSIRHAFAHVGRTMPGIRLECVNRIPHGRGLGSSSAAIVAGLLLAAGLLDDEAGDLVDQRVLVELACDLEGHPDNVAPAILGGFTLAWMTEQGVGRAVRLTAHQAIAPVVAIPETKLETQRARELLPDTVDHAEAAFNAGRSALLPVAFTGIDGQSPSRELLLAATHDLLHQDARQPAYPHSHSLVMQLRDRGIPAMISGAGPTVIALGVEGSDLSASAVEAAMVDVLGAEAQDWQVSTLVVDPQGAKIIS